MRRLGWFVAGWLASAAATGWILSRIDDERFNEFVRDLRTARSDRARIRAGVADDWVSTN